MTIDPNDRDYERKKRARNALYEVLDPELMVNVVDLGLIYEVEFNDEENKTEVLMTLTTRFCPMGEAIQTGVKNALEKEFPELETRIELTFDPAWNYDMVTPEGMEQLENRT